MRKKTTTTPKAKAAAPTKKEAAPAKAAATAKAKTATKAPAPAKAVKKAKIGRPPAAKLGFEEIMADMKAKTANFDASNYHGFLAIQVTLTDLDKVFYVEIKDGRLSIEPYEYHDRQANIIMNSTNFVKMINGKLNSVLAFTTGKLKVDGDVGKAGELGNLLKGK